MLAEYTGAVAILLISTILASALLSIHLLVGPRRSFAEKNEPFECGERPIVSPHQRFSVKFYMVAMLFIVFDIETVFMIPWGAYYRQLSCGVPLVGGACPTGNISFFGLGEMIVFMIILLAGYLYVWKKGALQWD